MWLLNLRSLVVATDLEAPSSSELETAARLGQLAGAHVHLLHVPEGGRRSEALEEELGRAWEEAAGKGARARSIRVVTGDPTRIIVDHARDLHADAIVLGPHRRRSDPGSLGTTAAGVVRDAPCPCLVASGDLELPLEFVLAPVTLSEPGELTLSAALSWASALRPRGRKVRLRALHLVENEAEVEAAKTRLEEMLERVMARAGEAARVQREVEVAIAPDVADEILRRLEEDPVGLLVIGSHGTDRAEIGGTTGKVASSTPCPMLLVPPIEQTPGRA